MEIAKMLCVGIVMRCDGNNDDDDADDDDEAIITPSSWHQFFREIVSWR